MSASASPGFVFRYADPALFDVLFARMRGETLAWLRQHGREPLPPAFAAWLRGSGERAAAVALAGSPLAWPGEERELARWLAGLGDPEVSAPLHRRAQQSAMAETVLGWILAAADPADPRWHEPEGLVDALLGSRRLEDLVPCLRAPFPRLVEHALRELGPDLDPGSWVAACRTVLEHGGPQRLPGLAWLTQGALGDGAAAGTTAHGAAFGPALAGLLREAAAAPDPGAVLDAAEARLGAVPPPDGAHVGLVLRLRHGLLLPDGAALDWDLVVREHRRKPLPDRALTTAAGLPDCPGELAVAAYRANAYWLPGERALPWECLDVVHAGDGPAGPRPRRGLIRRGLAQGWYPAERVLAEVRPALDVLTGIGFQEAPPAPVVRALGALTAPLGADPAAWVRLYTRMSRFKGSCTELVAEVADGAGRTLEAVWPRRTEAAFPGKSPDGARAGLVVLLSAAPEEAAMAVAPHLDPRAVQELLRFGRLTPRARDHLLAVHGRAAAVAWASYTTLPDEAAGFLLGLDDPDVNARLFPYLRDSEARAGEGGPAEGGPAAGGGIAAHAERERILAGVPRAGGRPGEVPVSEELVTTLSGRELSEVRPWLMAAVGSGHPRLVRILLGRVKLYTERARLRLLVRLWERHGPGEVEALLDEEAFPFRRTPKHPLPPATHRTARRALAAGQGGLDLLRRELARAEAPETVVAGLVRKPWSAADERVMRVKEEIGPLPWAALVAAHEAAALPAEVLAVLAEEPDCPRELLLGLLRAAPIARSSSFWAAYGDGRVTHRDIVLQARPAREAERFLLDAGRREADPPGRREAAALVAERLGKDPEAWAVAARLYPTFSGTLPELLDTVGNVMG